MDFGQRLKEIRKRNGLTQDAMAERLHVTRQAVSNWENDNIQPSIDMLVKIAGFFSVSTDYLLGLENKRYLEITGLSDLKITHIQQIIDDMRYN